MLIQDARIDHNFLLLHAFQLQKDYFLEITFIVSQIYCKWHDCFNNICL